MCVCVSVCVCKREIFYFSLLGLSYYLIFSVIFLAEPKNSVAKPENVFVGSMSWIRKFLNLEQRSFSIGRLYERSLQNPATNSFNFFICV